MSKPTIDEKWGRLANATMEEAQKLPHGREALERKARQLRTATSCPRCKGRFREKVAACGTVIKASAQTAPL